MPFKNFFAEPQTFLFKFEDVEPFVPYGYFDDELPDYSTSSYVDASVYSKKTPLTPPSLEIGKISKNWIPPEEDIDKNADAQRKLTHMETGVFGENVKEQTEE